MAHLSAAAVEARKEVQGLEKELEVSREETKIARNALIDAEREKGSHIGERLEHQKQEKLLRIIGHITGGRGNEAIQELLEPMPVVLSLDIRYGDDKTRVAAEEEQLGQMKATLIKAIEGATIVRHKNNAER